MSKLLEKEFITGKKKQRNWIRFRGGVGAGISSKHKVCWPLKHINNYNYNT